MFSHIYKVIASPVCIITHSAESNLASAESGLFSIESSMISGLSISLGMSRVADWMETALVECGTVVAMTGAGFNGA